MTLKNESGITSISPANGMRLYDGETIAEGTVYLGKNDAPENWREVTEEEAAEIEKRKIEEEQEDVSK